jgi:hypothetical protein
LLSVTVMSAKCHKRTHAPQQNESLSDQIISVGENSLVEPLCQSP